MLGDFDFARATVALVFMVAKQIRDARVIEIVKIMTWLRLDVAKRYQLLCFINVAVLRVAEILYNGQCVVLVEFTFPLSLHFVLFHAKILSVRDILLGNIR